MSSTQLIRWVCMVIGVLISLAGFSMLVGLIFCVFDFEVRIGTLVVCSTSNRIDNFMVSMGPVFAFTIMGLGCVVVVAQDIVEYIRSFVKRRCYRFNDMKNYYRFNNMKDYNRFDDMKDYEQLP